MEETERTPTSLEELRAPPRESPPPVPGPLNATAATRMDDVRLLVGADASMDDVLLRKRWTIHWMSRMYHFQRPELSAYAHELVKFLRDEALAAFKREFGYKVSIRHTDAFVAFEVQEEREARDAHLAPVLVVDRSAAGIPAALGRPLGNGTGSNRGRAQTTGVPPPPPSFAFGSVRNAGGSGFDLHAIANSDVNGSGNDSGMSNGSWLRTSENESKPSAAAVTAATKVRRGGFVLYFPSADEDEQQLRASMMQHKTKERQYIVLLRGHEGLLRWACAWLQQRFQCIVSERQMMISPLNLKWLARNWVINSLTRTHSDDESAAPASSDDSAGGNGDGSDDAAAAKAPQRPLLLKYRNLDEQSMMRHYTLTVPWATLQRLMDQHGKQTAAADGCGTSDGATPDLIQRTEELYFETLPPNMSAFELMSIAMAEAAVDQNGYLELYDLSLVHSVLRGLADLLCIQNVPGPANPVVTL